MIFQSFPCTVSRPQASAMSDIQEGWTPAVFLPSFRQIRLALLFINVQIMMDIVQRITPELI
jgi:hypothetical protein